MRGVKLISFLANSFLSLKMKTLVKKMFKGGKSGSLFQRKLCFGRLMLK